MEPTDPGVEWERASPEAAGFDPGELSTARERLDDRRDGEPYRVVVVRGGRIVAEWSRGVDPDERRGTASLSKSVYSSVLGAVAATGRLDPDDRVVDYYPEAVDVLEGEGPKAGRYARAEDRAITFRQLISNTSGYLKPGEAPGEVFHYQTFGMNVLTHALAAAHGLYDVDDPEGSPGFPVLVDTHLRRAVRGTWGYELTNFDLQPDAKLGVFGYYTDLQATCRDLARLGWLWCNGGRWANQQLVPADWLAAATDVAPAVREHEPREDWTYGYGFWTNAAGELWPALPDDSFAASGAGRKHVWVRPARDLVVAQSPGVYDDQRDLGDGLLGDVVGALE